MSGGRLWGVGRGRGVFDQDRCVRPSGGRAGRPVAHEGHHDPGRRGADHLDHGPTAGTARFERRGRARAPRRPPRPGARRPSRPPSPTAPPRRDRRRPLAGLRGSVRLVPAAGAVAPADRPVGQRHRAGSGARGGPRDAGHPARRPPRSRHGRLRDARRRGPAGRHRRDRDLPRRSRRGPRARVFRRRSRATSRTRTRRRGSITTATAISISTR